MYKPVILSEVAVGESPRRSRKIPNPCAAAFGIVRTPKPVSPLGILRLRGCLVSRSSHSAQDDKSLRMTVIRRVTRAEVPAPHGSS